MLIRKAKKEDIRVLVELNRKLREYIAKIDKYSRANKQTERIFRNFCIKNLRKRNFRYLVAENGKKKIIGYLSARISKAGPFQVPKKRGEILGFFVLREYRRKGVGERLFKKITEWFKENKVKRVEVEVHSKNLLGRKVWQKFGFTKYIEKMGLDL